MWILIKKKKIKVITTLKITLELGIYLNAIMKSVTL